MKQTSRIRNAAGRAASIALLAAPLAACGGESAAAGSVVRDSAGVRIVESASPAWTERQAWRVGSDASLDLGVADGDPAQVGPDWILGVEKDELEVEHVRMYPLVKPAG